METLMPLCAVSIIANEIAVASIFSDAMSIRKFYFGLFYAITCIFLYCFVTLKADEKCKFLMVIGSAINMICLIFYPQLTAFFSKCKNMFSKMPIWIIVPGEIVILILFCFLIVCLIMIFGSIEMSADYFLEETVRKHIANEKICHYMTRACVVLLAVTPLALYIASIVMLIRKNL